MSYLYQIKWYRSYPSHNIGSGHRAAARRCEVLARRQRQAPRQPHAHPVRRRPRVRGPARHHRPALRGGQEPSRGFKFSRAQRA
jgi:hypothetical protein